MSLNQAIECRCPACGKGFSASVWLSVNSVLSPELKREILNGALNWIRCPHCGTMGRSTESLLYHDTERRVMFYVLSTSDPAARLEAEQRSREIIATLPGNVSSNTAVKVLQNMNDLRRIIHTMDTGQNPDGSHLEFTPAEWIDVADALCMAPKPWPLDHICVCGEAIPIVCFCRQLGSRINIAKYEPSISPDLTIRCWKCWRKLCGFSCVKCNQTYQWSLGVVDKLTPSLVVAISEK